MLRHRDAHLSSDAVVELAVQVCDALAYVHSRADEAGRPLDLVHRDISPHNLLVDRSGTVKLADFGIARSADRMSQTATGMLKGKVSYMAPEQLRGETYDQRVDLYALGVVLFELATGHRLYEGLSEQALVFHVVNGDPPPLDRLTDVSPPLAQLIRQALRFPVAERVQRAADLRAALVGLRQPDRGRSELARAVTRACEWQHQRQIASSVSTSPALRKPAA
jgi:serine/threonine-protein kinase